MDNDKDNDDLSVQANDNSVAVGNNFSANNNTGTITIGNTYNYATSEEDTPFTSAELERGLTRFAEYLPVRAPVLQEKFTSFAKKLRLTLGAELNALSPTLKTQREDTVNQMKLMCMEVLDISFRALCTGQNPPPYDSRSPFQGLVAFHPDDKEFYFGREALIEKLVTRIKAHPFLAVMGASGSGKSSLVMAGLMPALEAQMAYLTPSSDPLNSFHAAQQNADKDSVYVVDQFEELFTLTQDANVREAFIQELLELSKTNHVVVTMRADFWGEVAAYKDLKQAMQDHQELIAPMNTDELHSAMEQQAAAVGLRFDSMLSETILDEVKGEPGAMPLLQHALWLLWKRRHGLWLKTEEYHAFGGVKQAIASTAEEVYASCSDPERDRIQNIFLRLTRLDDSGEGRDTRRRVLIQDLIPAHSDTSATVQLLDKLADARLIITTDKEAEVAHEALIRHWDRLTRWLNDDRDNLHLREGVSEDAREWEKSNHDESLLNHRGGRLELALAMSQNPRYQLNPVEQAYLNACVEVRERARLEKEAQQQRELEAAKKLAETAQAKAQAERRGRLIGRGLLVIAFMLIAVLSYSPIRNAILRQQALGPELILIPKSEAHLGGSLFSNDDPETVPEKTYSVDTFRIEPYEVTNERYLLCVSSGTCSAPIDIPANYEGKTNAQKPVVNITAVQAGEFCAWLGRQLPNELQWERAARYTDGRHWPWGNTAPSEQTANFFYDPSSSAVQTVGRYAKGKSPEGVYDLAGNVWEWTISNYYDYQKIVDLNNFKDTDALSTRGGAYDVDTSSVMKDTIAIRYPAIPLAVSSDIGFRCIAK